MSSSSESKSVSIFSDVAAAAVVVDELLLFGKIVNNFSATAGGVVFSSGTGSSSRGGDVGGSPMKCSVEIRKHDGESLDILGGGVSISRVCENECVTIKRRNETTKKSNQPLFDHSLVFLNRSANEWELSVEPNVVTASAVVAADCPSGFSFLANQSIN